MHFVNSAKKAAIFALCAAPLLALADPVYTITIIGGANSQGLGINNSGQVVGSMMGDNNAMHGFLYSGSGLFDLGTFGGRSSTAFGINDAGQVVGSAADGSGNNHAFLYSGGTMTDLGTLGGGSSTANAINNAGMITGGAQTANGEMHTFVYANGVMQDLGTLPASGWVDGYGKAINNNAMIAGASSVGPDSPTQPTHAFVREDGGPMVDLGTFGGRLSYALGLNDLGEAVGISRVNDGFANAFIYSNGQMTPIGALGGGYGAALDINNLSQAVGWAQGWGMQGGFLYENGKMVALDTLIDPASGWHIQDADAINDMQQIAGTACKDGVCYAVRLDLVSPVPEPGQYAMLGAGVLLLGACFGPARRRRQSAVRSANSSGNSTTSSILRR